MELRIGIGLLATGWSASAMFDASLHADVIRRSHSGGSAMLSRYSCGPSHYFVGQQSICWYRDITPQQLILTFKPVRSHTILVCSLHTHKDSPIIMPIQSAMSLIRWEQLRRYLKISNPSKDNDSKWINWYAKVELLYSDFVKASRAHLMPGRDVSVDEQLILFKGRSKHTMLIPTKRAEKGFKIYSLCYQN